MGFCLMRRRAEPLIPLMGAYPLGFDMEPQVEAATLKFYLGLREGYIGSPMLSALYGVWAAYSGDRALSAQLMEDGYGRFCVGRFLQTLEYREDVFPEQPRAGPFFANLGGFLLGLVFSNSRASARLGRCTKLGTAASHLA